MKVELTVPSSLSEITLGQYQQYLKLPLEELTEEYPALFEDLKLSAADRTG